MSLEFESLIFTVLGAFIPTSPDDLAVTIPLFRMMPSIHRAGFLHFGKKWQGGRGAATVLRGKGR